MIVLCFAGPDICGYSTKKVHVIFNYNGNNLLTTKDIKCKVSVSTGCIKIVVLKKAE